MAETRTFTARWVFPVAGPPLDRGTVTITGDTIVAVGPHGVRTADDDLGNVGIIPGLVNAHTHLDLSGARGLIPPTDPDHFTDWLRGVIAYRRTRTPEQVQGDIHLGLDECLRAGTILIGDITSGGASWDAVSHAKTRAVLFWEIIGLSEERFKASFDEWYSKTGQSWDDDEAKVAIFPSSPLCRWAVSPHAPYSANHLLSRTYLASGFAAMHFAESPAEIELLSSRSGPFTLFLSELGIWNPSDFNVDWSDFLLTSSYNSSSQTRLFIHCNYLPPDFPFKPQHTVVYCPRTHAAFGHPPHPFRAFLSRGVRVCLGTDSLASNPDLDILAEARFVRGRYPDFPGETLLRMVTLSGAQALGWADAAGSLEPGKSADFVAVPLPDRDAADPHELLFAADAPDAPRRTLFRGEWRESAG
jgi:cytosine/adenosine deaminase-related metal-dependent hydrolase